MRVARLNRERSPETSSTRGQIWFWLAEGSGIWWNTGKSKRALTTGEASALWYALPLRPCTMLREEGYDSIQHLGFENGFSFELIDCRGADLPTFDVSVDVACPPPHVELRAGVPPRASRWAPALDALPEEAEGTVPCRCDPSSYHLNCQG